MQDFLGGGKHMVAENHGGVKTPNAKNKLKRRLVEKFDSFGSFLLR